MGKLIYAALASLDGYIEDVDGGFGWAAPDAEVHEFVNELERGTGTALYGRRMYETMAVWQTMGAEPDDHPAEVAYAELWRGMDKVVFSSTLDDVWTPRTRLERAFDPDAVRQMKADADRDLSVSGPGIAQHAFRAGLVDEVHLFLSPVVVGGGKAALPADVRLDLELVDERRFGNGVVHLHHRVR
jgi:dihydrofolate reductase